MDDEALATLSGGVYPITFAERFVLIPFVLQNGESLENGYLIGHSNLERKLHYVNGGQKIPSLGIPYPRTKLGSRLIASSIW